MEKADQPLPEVQSVELATPEHDSHQALKDAIASKTGAVALHKDFSTHDVEDFLPNRRRMRGDFLCSTIQSFAEYTAANAELGTFIFVEGNEDVIRAQAVLNLGTPDFPGHADNLAALVPRETAAFAALKEINGQTLDQKQAAEWMEDWREHLAFFAGDQSIEPKAAIAAVRKITLDSTRSVEASVQNLSASRSVLEQAQAKSAGLVLPDLLRFITTPYRDLEERVFALRVSIYFGEAVLLKLSVQQLEIHAEEMAKEFAVKVRSAFAGKNNCPVLLGSYFPKK